jgi:transcriptional regulator with XRE-family HTH domain
MLLKTGDQLRAARMLAGLTQSELAKRCGMHLNSISAMEKRGAKTLTSGLDTLNEVVRALESLGIEFTNGDAIGVRLHPKPSKAKK